MHFSGGRPLEGDEFFVFFISRCWQWWQDWNPWSWDNEVNVLPLCYYLPIHFFRFFGFSISRCWQQWQGLEPLTLGWKTKCSTTVLLLTNKEIGFDYILKGDAWYPCRHFSPLARSMPKVKLETTNQQYSATMFLLHLSHGTSNSG